MPKNSECAACGRADRLYCDHDHATKEFRGWICRKCNAGLGLLGDSEEGLRRALEYLERARSRSPKSVVKDKKTDDEPEPENCKPNNRAVGPGGCGDEFKGAEVVYIKDA